MIVINCILFVGADFDDLSDRGAAPAIYIFSVIAFFIVWMSTGSEVVTLSSFLILLFSPVLLNLPIWLVVFCKDDLFVSHQNPFLNSTSKEGWNILDVRYHQLHIRFDKRVAKAEYLLSGKHWIFSKYRAQKNVKHLNILEKEMRCLFQQKIEFFDTINSYASYQESKEFQQNVHSGIQQLRHTIDELVAFRKKFKTALYNLQPLKVMPEYQNESNNIWEDYHSSQEESFWKEYEALLVDMKATVDPNITSAS